jgi:dipeptidase E
MKLFLSSMHPSNRQALLDLFESQTLLSAVVIPTGWDTYPVERKETELSHILTTLKDFGFSTSLLDLTSSSEDSIHEALKRNSLVWIMAGNTFYLNFHMHKSGFAKIIKSHLEAGLVYGGESAGAVVAGSTLHGVECVDDPAESPEVIWDGLGLVDHGILPHADWEKYRKLIAAARHEMKKFADTVTINNDQALVVVDQREATVNNPSSEESS